MIIDGMLGELMLMVTLFLGGISLFQSSSGPSLMGGGSGVMLSNYH